MPKIDIFQTTDKDKQAIIDTLYAMKTLAVPNKDVGIADDCTVIRYVPYSKFIVYMDEIIKRMEKE